MPWENLDTTQITIDGYCMDCGRRRSLTPGTSGIIDASCICSCTRIRLSDIRYNSTNTFINRSPFRDAPTGYYATNLRATVQRPLSGLNICLTGVHPTRALDRMDIESNIYRLGGTAQARVTKETHILVLPSLTPTGVDRTTKFNTATRYGVLKMTYSEFDDFCLRRQSRLNGPRTTNGDAPYGLQLTAVWS